MRSPALAVAAPIPTAARSIPRRLTLSLVVEGILVVALVALAAAIRLPHLWQIPELTDEAWEVWWGYDIYRGRHLPLTNITTFVGPLWNYLVAGLFWVSGPSPFTPRLLIMAIGTLTLVPTYFLGREIGGPRAGLFAAALLATNGGHIVSNSHIAWSSCTTPLFGATGLWLLARAINRRHGPSLVGAGLFLGLAWQTHGTFMFLLPGAAAYVLWRGQALLRTGWAPLALVAMATGLAPLIVFNLQTGFETVREAAAHDQGISKVNLPMPQRYVVRAGTVGLASLRLVGGAVDNRSGGSRDYLLDPKVWLYGALALSGVAFAWRAGQPLPALILASGLLIWPFFSAGVDALPWQARYLTPMLPSTFAAIGLLLARLTGDRPGLPHGRGGQIGSLREERRLVAPLAWAAATLLVIYPLLPVQSYYDEQQANGKVNEVAYSLILPIEQAIRPDEEVLLDPRINLWSFGGNGAGHRAFRYLFELYGIDTERILADRELSDYVECGGSELLLMREMEYRKLGEGAAQLARRGMHLSTVAPPGEPSPVFAVYRVERDPCSGSPTRRERAARRDQRAAERDAEMREEILSGRGSSR